MKRLLIIGAGSAGQMVANEILKHKLTRDKYRLIGFIDDKYKKDGFDSILNIPILGKINNIKKIISDKGIIEVIIAIPSAESSTINRIIRVFLASVLVINCTRYNYIY